MRKITILISLISISLISIFSTNSIAEDCRNLVTKKAIEKKVHQIVKDEGPKTDKITFLTYSILNRKGIDTDFGRLDFYSILT